MCDDIPSAIFSMPHKHRPRGANTLQQVYSADYVRGHEQSCYESVAALHEIRKRGKPTMIYASALAERFIHERGMVTAVNVNRVKFAYGAPPRMHKLQYGDTPRCRAAAAMVCLKYGRRIRHVGSNDDPVSRFCAAYWDTADNIAARLQQLTDQTYFDNLCKDDLPPVASLLPLATMCQHRDECRRRIAEFIALPNTLCEIIAQYSVGLDFADPPELRLSQLPYEYNGHKHDWYYRILDIGIARTMLEYHSWPTRGIHPWLDKIFDDVLRAEGF